jgi:hypothetical protein
MPLPIRATGDHTGDSIGTYYRLNPKTVAPAAPSSIANGHAVKAPAYRRDQFQPVVTAVDISYCSSRLSLWMVYGFGAASTRPSGDPCTGSNTIIC